MHEPGASARNVCRIPPRTGAAFRLPKGATLTVIDPQGEQVSDLVAFNADDIRERISSGRSIDYASRIFLTTDDILYSNRSRPMLTIVGDDVGRHDFSLTPCSRDTFRILYGDTDPHHGCQGNLEQALGPFGIAPDDIPVAFNVFMHVTVDGDTGEIAVLPPKSRAGDRIVFRAEMDLVVGLTACSAGQSNNFRFKPIDYVVGAAA
ncbi:urea carboxylase-associated protein [Rhodobium orientis]|uniref:Urea carboxylase-associated protein n=1 Tax=Rhodobium orientis TaxID=34017 RepID=A0A327JMJ6_9HYPH|nr:urea carboxylase-associated family protein [Rhodobium orientis]MBK5951367.1 urea carboxylase-associated protein [Rhodobium orientis]RAI27557.1 urea carboxylase-associated protein [Rhodobium orientis]